MSNYSSLQVLLEETVPALGYEYLPLNGNDAQKTDILIRSLSKNFVLSWKVDNTLLFSAEIKSQVAEKLRTLFFNQVWFKNESNINSVDDIQDFISANLPNENPESRILSVLQFIYAKTPFAGDTVDISSSELSFEEEYWRNMFFHLQSEFAFYVNAAEELGYLSIQDKYAGNFFGIGLTAKGLGAIIEIENQNKSKSCFVAMSFVDEMFRIYEEAIRPAILETGFEPLIISEKKDIPSDITINDAILAAIKKSKFTIADFTEHKHGVYFESGYALGRGQKVIYTCRQDEIGKAHFDTRNYPHIIWKDAEDLKKQLIDKIEVFIKS